jgi:hypothetical protein
MSSNHQRFAAIRDLSEQENGAGRGAKWQQNQE